MIDSGASVAKAEEKKPSKEHSANGLKKPFHIVWPLRENCLFTMLALRVGPLN
jgi:hypothetical protein